MISPTGSGNSGDFVQGRGHGLDPRRGQAEAIDGGVGQAEAGGGIQVMLVGFDQRGRVLDKPLAGGPQPGLFLCPGDHRQVGGGLFGTGRYFQAVGMQIIHGGSIPRKRAMSTAIWIPAGAGILVRKNYSISL